MSRRKSSRAACSPRPRKPVWIYRHSVSKCSRAKRNCKPKLRQREAHHGNEKQNRQSQSRARNARNEAWQAQERPIWQDGDESKTGDCHRPLRGPQSRREDPQKEEKRQKTIEIAAGVSSAPCQRSVSRQRFESRSKVSAAATALLTPFR